MSYDHAAEATVAVHATAVELFDYLDDQARLGAHMAKPSMMMIGGRMTYEFDEAKGRSLGSVIKMGGSVAGFRLSVEEVVTERDRPRRKVWETRGQPQLLIIGAYRMGFEIATAGATPTLRVFIEYNHPAAGIGRAMSAPFARMYARWCVRRMTEDAKRRFQSATSATLGVA